MFLVSGVYALLRMPPVSELYPDPSYPYLMNGLALVVGPGPAHTDHPGTSLQWLVGLVSQAAHLVTGSGTTLVDDVVARPETYLTINAMVLVVAQALALWALGWRLAKGGFGIGAALIAQAVTAGAVVLIPWRLFVIPEAFQFAIALLVLAALAPWFRNPGAVMGWRVCAVVGVLLAMGLTAKVTFAPLVLMPLVLLGWRAILLVYAWFAGAVVVIMWVARDRLQQMWDWYTAVASTTARYPEEVVSRSAWENLASLPLEILRNHTLLVAAVALVIVGLVLHLRRGERTRPTVRALLALALGLLGTLAFAYKAYRPNDLLLLVPLTAMLAALGWWLVRDGRPARRWTTVVPVTVAVLGAVLCVTWSVRFIATSTAPTDYRSMIAYLEEQAAAGATVATGYGVFNTPTSLAFGNDWSGNFAGPETVQRYPNWIDLNIWNGYIYPRTADGTVTLATCDQLAALIGSPGGLLLAPGRDFTPGAPGMQYADLLLVPDQVFGTQVVYRAQAVTCS